MKMSQELAGAIRMAYSAVRAQETWMQDTVRGCPHFTEEDRRSFANVLGVQLYTGRCDCGLQCCPKRHDLAAQAHSEVNQLPLFVDQAVIGPLGRNNPRAKSIDQGMFYRLILKVDYGMLVAKVEFKVCANPRCPRRPAGDDGGRHCLYEEDHCPGDRCDSTFTPDRTQVVADERLFVQGLYVPVRRWRCRGGDHYFRQDRCRDAVVRTFPGAAYHVRHSADGAHDHCPWCGCPGRKENPRHPQNGTTLWVRDDLVGPDEVLDEGASAYWKAHAEALSHWLPTLDRHGRQRLGAAAQAANVSLDDDPLDVCDWLLHDNASGLLAEQRVALGQAIEQALKEGAGFEAHDEAMRVRAYAEAIHDWLLTLDEAVRKELAEAAKAVIVSLDGEPLKAAAWLVDRKANQLSDGQRAALRAAIDRALNDPDVRGTSPPGDATGRPHGDTGGPTQ